MSTKVDSAYLDFWFAWTSGQTLQKELSDYQWFFNEDVQLKSRQIKVF